MGMSYAEWRDVVKTHYGGLSHFADATTVRFYYRDQYKRAMDLLEISEQLRIFGDESAYQQFKDVFADTLREHIDASRELYLWLKERDLKI